MIVLRLEGERAQSWNKYYAGAHWTKRRREAERVHALVMSAVADYAAAYWHSVVTGFTEPVEVSVIARYKSKPVDVDNVMVKLYIDGLRAARIIIDDDPLHITALHVCSEKYHRDEVVIAVHEWVAQ